MTRRDILDRFHNLMDSYLRVYWNDTRATALLNAVKDRLAQRFTVNNVEQLYTFLSVQGDQAYQVPSTYIRHRYMYFNSGNNQVIKMLDGPENIYGPAADQTIEGIPSRSYIWGVSGRRELTIYPTFNDDDIEVMWWFYGWPPDVEVDNDEPHLPIDWHPSIIEIMRAEQQQHDHEISVADKYAIWTHSTSLIQAMDVTKEIMSLSDNQSGSIDAVFPEIQNPPAPDFLIEYPGGAIGEA